MSIINSTVNDVYTQAPISQSLQQIRILVLAPGADDEPLCGTFTAKSVNSDDLKYDALSYAWSGVVNESVIHIGGAPLHITENLKSALLHFRISAPRNVWVDAICINQSDTDEKGFQVALMGKIYERARFTWIWLGEASADSDAAIDFVGTHEMQLDRRLDDLSEKPKVPVHALANLMDRKWWTRIWVVQEVLMAERAIIHCGHRIIELIHFVHLLEAIADADSVLRGGGELVSILTFKQQPFMNLLSDWYRHRRQVIDNKMSLRQLLRLTTAFQSSLRRDRLFALLALTTPEARSWIVPDYSEAVSDRLIFTRLTMYFLQTSMEPLRLASYCQTSEYPSWVADWTSLDEELLKQLDLEEQYLPSLDDDERSVYEREQLSLNEGEAIKHRPQFKPAVEKLTKYQESSTLLFGTIMDVVESAVQMPSLQDFPTSGIMKSRISRWEECVANCISNSVSRRTRTLGHSESSNPLPAHASLLDAFKRMLISRIPYSTYNCTIHELQDDSKLAFAWYQYLRLLNTPQVVGSEYEKFRKDDNVRLIQYEIVSYAACVRPLPRNEEDKVGTDESIFIPKICSKCGRKNANIEGWWMCPTCIKTREVTAEGLNETITRRKRVHIVFSTTAGAIADRECYEGSSAIQAGDVICRLQFANWPFVLRKGAEDSWRLVGHLPYWHLFKHSDGGLRTGDDEADMNAEEGRWFRLQ